MLPSVSLAGWVLPKSYACVYISYMSVGNNEKPKARAAHLGPERRRPAVLDAALKLAVGQGLRAVSMEAVAQELGVTKPVVYACFPSREALLEALLEREEQRLFAGVIAALPEGPDFRNPKALFDTGFRALLMTVAEHKESWRLVFMAEPDPTIAGRYGEARRRVAAVVAQLMRPGLEQVGVQDIERKLPVLVELFMSIGDGAVRTLLQGGESWSPDALGSYIGRIVFAALKEA